MEISGHKTRSVFDRYNITDERDVREAMKKQQSYLEQLSPGRVIVPFEKANRGSK